MWYAYSMTNKVIAHRHNLKVDAKVIVQGDPGIVVEAGNIFCKIRFSYGTFTFSYSELNGDSEFTFERL